VAGPILDLRCSTFEEIEVGDSASFSWHLSDEDIVAFATLSGDRSPLHIDEQFARRSRFRSRIAHGMLVASPVSALVGMLLPGKHATLLGVTLKLAGPVRAGDELRLEGVIKAASPAARAVVVAFTVAVANRIVARGEAQVLVNTPPKEAPTMSDLEQLKLDMDFAGHVAVVTGASRGIGEVAAKLFATHHAAVVVNYLRGEDDAERIADDIRQQGGLAMAAQADVRDSDAVRRMMADAIDRFGSVDILVNNAAADADPEDFGESQWEDFTNSWETVVGGAFNCIQAVLPGMLDRGAGRIVNVCTTYVEAPPPRLSPYVTAKAALLGLTRSLAVELGPHGVRVNAVSPAMTETDLTAHLPLHDKSAAAARSALGRLADPLDVAKAILFLSSPYADYVNAHELVLSGGSVAP